MIDSNRFPVRSAVSFLFLSLYYCLLVADLSAQQALTGTTPSGILPGGSSPGSLDNINYYNGNLNFNLPLLKIGGRGEAAFTLSLNIDQTWTSVGAGPNSVPAIEPGEFYLNVDKPPTFNPGHLVGRMGVDDFAHCSDGNYMPWYSHTLTRLTFTSTDGSQYEFVDAATGGLPTNWAYWHGTNCFTGYQTRSRGRVFYSTDRTATFISDADVIENNYSPVEVSMTGWLKFNNGLSYRIENSLTTKIIDRNGNFITFSYAGGELVSITDSANRQVSIEYNVDDVQPYGLCDRITYNGTGGNPRVIRISKKSYGSDVLRSDYSILSSYQMWGFGWTNNYYTHVKVPSAVWLPNQQKYEFKYNNYIELARVDLPSGGAYEYDHDSGYSATSTPSGGILTLSDYNWAVYRRLVAKRVYVANGELEKTTTISRYQYSPVSAHSEVTATNYAADQQLLSKTKHFFAGEPSQSFQMKGIDYNGSSALEVKTEVFGSDGGTPISRTESTWQFFGAVSMPQYAFLPPAPGAPRMTARTTSLLEISPSLVAKETYNYASNYSLSDVYSYDLGMGAPGGLLNRVHISYVTDSNYTSFDGPHLRELPDEIWISSDAAGFSRMSLVHHEYDNYSSGTQNAGLVARSSVTGHDSAQYGSGFFFRGNLTATTGFANAQAQTGEVSVFSQFDVLGNVIKTIDARGNYSTISFDDNYGSPDGDARSNTQPAQINGLNTFLHPTRTTNPAGWTNYSQFDYFTGNLVNSEDSAGVISKTVYNDALDRPTQTVTAIGTASEIQSSIVYDDAIGRIEMKSDLFALNDNLSRSERFYDGLGRTSEARRYETGGFVAIKMEYDPLDRLVRVTNPYRPLVNETQHWTKTTYDALGRVKKVINADNSETNVSYVANSVTVADEAGSVRRSIWNAVGQLTEVHEPDESGNLGTISDPFVATNYSYDAIGNLTEVSQDGFGTAECGPAGGSCSQSRSFVYNSLSWLVATTMPESGTIQYSYDSNGNLSRRIDARGVQTDYIYDVLNRVTNRNYSTPSGTPANYQATPSVTYTYDNQTNARGRLTKISSSVSTTEYLAFDILGRVTRSKQTTDGVEYGGGSDPTRWMTYTYNLSGTLVAQQYPSGRVVKNTLDSADGSLSQIQSGKTGVSLRNFANGFNYNSAGAVTSMRLGNGLWETTTFNSRLQPTQIGLGSGSATPNKLKLDYSYGTSANNGNVLSQTITIPGVTLPFVQNYTYDSLNRLKTADEKPAGWTQPNCDADPTACWNQTFIFDRYGNRNFDEANTNFPGFDKLCSGGTALCPDLKKRLNPSINTSNNRPSVNDGYDYDASGNVTIDPEGRTFVYDARNKQVSISDNDGLIGEYFYDGHGMRVKKIVPGEETTVFVYDAAGKLIGEYSDTVQSASNAKTAFSTNDYLGSPRIITDATGNVVSRHDYRPYGEEISRAGYGFDNARKKFTGYQRDIEAGLDFAQARFYNYQMGRFQSPDRYSQAILLTGAAYQKHYTGQPQNWNGYSYCRNNPVSYADSDGNHPALALLVPVIGGAALGAGFGIVAEIAVQKLWEGRKDIDENRVWGAAAQGAIFGAVAGLTGGSGLALPIFRQTAALAFANAVGGGVNRAISGGDVLDGPQIVINAASGGVAGNLGSRAANYYAQTGVANAAAIRSAQYTANEALIASSPLPSLSRPLTGGPGFSNYLNRQLVSGVGPRMFEGSGRTAGNIGTASILDFLGRNIERTVYAPGQTESGNFYVDVYVGPLAPVPPKKEKENE